MVRYTAISGDSERNGAGEENIVENSAIQVEDGAYELSVGMQFDSEEDAKMFYEEYAKHLGFRTIMGQCSGSKSGGGVVTRELICIDCLKVKGNDNCQALFRVERKDQHKWVVTKFVKQHSHSIASNSVHIQRPGRHISSLTNIPETCKGIGIVPSGVMHVSMDNRRPINPCSTRYTCMSLPRKSGFLLGNDAQNLLDYMKRMQAENPGFFYAIQLDENHRMTNVFWADARSRSSYSHFGDVLNLDTMYRVNQYCVPFAPITGVNHHGQTVLFGCALILDDSETSFMWLFKTFLAAMNDRHPISITTDQDRAIQAAVSHVFPGVRHCISKWHVLREGQERLANVGYTHPQFQAELYNCINLSETVDEFESSWSSIIAKYDVGHSDWLQSIYNARTRWVPAYCRDCFFAGLFPGSGLDSSFFEGYVNQHTTLPMFFRQYERAMENWFERETEADSDTLCTTPVLRTPSPMEKQAANLYTRKVFSKFQEELVETFVYTANRIEHDGASSTFRVVKFEDNSKCYIVTLNTTEMRASCSCRMFEYSGILCRHVLTVFTVSNVLTLPPHYILRRWTRNAKCMTGLEEHGSEASGQDSLTSRFNNLVHEAVRYSEEGAVALETYDLALGILREGRKKISITKRNMVNVTPSHPDRRMNSSSNDMTPLLWPRQDEGHQSFNLNYSSSQVHPPTDLNMPRMGPVSIHEEDGPPGNMGVLPYLKSMTWVMENKNSMPTNRVAVINLKLQDYMKCPSTESEITFQLSRASLEPMLKSMSHTTEQLSPSANRIAVVNLKLQDKERSSGESEVRFQVSKDTLGAMLRSMIYIREQLSSEAPVESTSKRHKKMGL